MERFDAVATWDTMLGKLSDADRHPEWLGLPYRSVTVPTISLDSFVYDQGHRPPDVLKIDVEGAESRVLTGAARLLRNHAPIMVLSVHGEQQKMACLDLLDRFGYDV